MLLKGVTEDVKVEGRLTKPMRFADGQAMIAASQKGLQRMMDRPNKTSEEYDVNKIK